MSVSPEQVVVEYKGRFLLLSEYLEDNPVCRTTHQPYVLFYTMPNTNKDIVVDATEYGNDARYVRRSCNPNSEVN